MASNVFGTPITNETLKGMPNYVDKEITQLDRAQVAMEMKNEEGKDVNARKMAEDLKDKFGDSVATMVLIYNATGNAMTFLREYEWEGHLCESPYPSVIYNGQWGVFVHGKYLGGPNISKAAVVYRAKTSSGVVSEWCLAWANERAVDQGQNRVLVEIFREGYYDNGKGVPLERSLDATKKRLVSIHINEGGYMVGSIGNKSVTFVEEILTLPKAII